MGLVNVTMVICEAGRDSTMEPREVATFRAIMIWTSSFLTQRCVLGGYRTMYGTPAGTTRTSGWLGVSVRNANPLSQASCDDWLGK